MNEKKNERKIQREANEIAARTDMVGETPTQREVGYVNEPKQTITRKTSATERICENCGQPIEEGETVIMDILTEKWTHGKCSIDPNPRLWFNIDGRDFFLTFDELRRKFLGLTLEEVTISWNEAAKDQPKRKNANPGCHECGLEAIDDCLEFKVHIPSDDFCSCKYCIRNPHALKPIGDFWAEEWCVDVDNEAIIEDPTPEQEIMLTNLQTYEIIRINGGEK